MTTQKDKNMRRMKWIRPMAVAVGLCVALSACETGNQNNAQQQTQPKLDSMEQAKLAELQKIFFSIPAPMEMASLIKESGFSFDSKLLNSTENVTKYAGEMKQAVNLGIYGADLSYASMFDQKQESMNYLAAAQKLAREMGVADALDEKTVERLNSNQDSRDSLMKIVSEAYADLNGYLKENDRVEVAALVVSGGWIEALYLSTQYSGAGNSAIRQRIAEQKYSLTNLLEYFDKFGDKEVLREMKADLLSLRDIYNEVTATAGKTEAKKEADGMVVIGNSSSMAISDETLKKIETKVKEIRSKYTA
jgi:uncharacterized protein YihD (DUF1040 family)